MSKVRVEDYYDEDDEMTTNHLKTNKKNHHSEYDKEYNGRKLKSKNKFKKMRGSKDNYEAQR